MSANVITTIHSSVRSGIISLTILICISNMLYGSNSGNILVLNGEEADIGDYPYTVAIFHNGVYSATGVVIGEQWILTAAHVISDRNINDFVLVFGQTDINRVNIPPWENDGWGDFQIAVPEEFVLHPDYDPNLTLEDAFELADHDDDRAHELWDGHDIALIRIAEEHRIDNERIINFMGANDNRVRTGLMVQFTGWGEISENTINTNLHVGTFNIDRLFLEGTIIITDSQNDNNPIIADGDSGGPLITNFGGRHWLIGIAASGSEDTNNGALQSSFVRVDRHSEWIQRVTGIMAGRPPRQNTMANNWPVRGIEVLGVLATMDEVRNLMTEQARRPLQMIIDPTNRDHGPHDEGQLNLTDEEQPMLQNQQPNIDDEDEEKFDIYEEDRRARAKTIKDKKNC